MPKQKEDISMIATQEDCEPVDLLQETFAASDQKGFAADEHKYTVDVDGEQVELNLEQLLELARLCLTMQMQDNGTMAATGMGTNGAAVLSDVPELLAFVQNYPDVREFPPEVEALIRQGKQPLEAYRSYENDQLRKKLRAFEQNDSNQKTSLGSVKGEADCDELDGLMAIYNSVFK